jgi:hypothetical protein
VDGSVLVSGGGRIHRRNPVRDIGIVNTTTQVLEGQLKTANDAPVTVSNAGAYAGKILSKVAVQREPVVGADGTTSRM